MHQQIEMGAPAYQALRAQTQAPTCESIIPQQEAERLILSMPPMTQEQALWMRRVDRALRRELARRERERHQRLVDMIVSLVTALSVGFVLYVGMFLWLL